MCACRTGDLCVCVSAHFEWFERLHEVAELLCLEWMPSLV